MTNESDPKSPVVLTSVPSEIEAAAIVTAMSAEGIEATATGGLTAGFRAEAPGEVQVMVRREDLAEARRLFDELLENRGDVDWSQVDVGEAEPEDR